MELVPSGTGAQAPGQKKKKAPSYKPQASSFKLHKKNTIKMYKVIRKKKL
jgi:hypothetical protein